MYPLADNASRRGRTTAEGFTMEWMRILIADEDARRGEVMASYLRVGHDVRVVGTARDALERIQAESWGLLIVSEELPDAHGLEMVDAAHDFAPLLPAIVVVLGTLREGIHEDFMKHEALPMHWPLTVSELWLALHAAHQLPLGLYRRREGLQT